MEGYLAEVRLWAANFAPRGWMFCWGQTLSISQYTALFALLGTTYGGNGTTTFQLPDLRGRVPVGVGAGTGLTQRVLGDVSGSETVTLLASEIPAHTHALNVNSGGGDNTTPASNYPAATDTEQAYSASAGSTANAAAIGVTGGSLPHNNMPPFVGLNYIICYEGIFPSRDW